MINMIPKIIHQTAPRNEEEWSPIWKECQLTWKKHFFDFEYIFWDDDDLRNLVKDKYPEFLECYDSFPYEIVKIDFARFCILHSYGGIYVDMDIYCYKNFYNMLENDIYLVESWPMWGEKIQNSLMISKPNHNFWLECMNRVKDTFNPEEYTRKELDKDDEKRKQFILKSCGPKFLTKILEESDDQVEILPKEIFNPRISNQFNWANFDYESKEHLRALREFEYWNSMESDVITRHYLTGNWSKLK